VLIIEKVRDKRCQGGRAVRATLAGSTKGNSAGG